MTLCRVVDDEICFHVKEAYNVYQMFHTRYSLFKMVRAVCGDEGGGRGCRRRL